MCAQEYNFRTFGSSDGLTNLSVEKIYQDRTGFIWVSTENGLYRYNDQRFEAFGRDRGLPPNEVLTFGDAPDGSLLVGGSIGLFHQQGNHFEKLSLPFHTVSAAQGIQSDERGHTYLGTDAGLMELFSEPGQSGFLVRKIPQVRGTSGPQADAVLVDGNNLWYGCGHELCRMNEHGTQRYGNESGLRSGTVMAIQKDRDGTLWVLSGIRGQVSMRVFTLAPNQSRFQKVDFHLPDPAYYNAPALDADGNILLPTSGGLFVHEKNLWHQINRSVGLRGNVNVAFADHQHSLWIGLEGRGLALWRGYGEWETYASDSGLGSDLVYGILPLADKTLWVATQGGLVHGIRKQFGWTFNKIAELSGFAIHSVQMDTSGNIWIGSGSRGVARLDVHRGSVRWFGKEQGLSNTEIHTLCFDHKQRLWVATVAGLFVAKAPYENFTQIAAVPSTWISTVVEGSDGTIWAGGVDGLFRYKDGQWRTLTHADGLSNQDVLSLGPGPDGAVWVGYRYGGGIDRVKSNARNVTIEKVLQRPGNDGLVYFLHFDALGRLWAGTERGVDMLDGSWWSHYDTSDGLAWEDCNLNSFAEEPDGTVWIGTSGGLSHFKPLHYTKPTTSMRVVFTGLLEGSRDISELHNPSFDFQSNSLTARYTALNTHPESNILFRYKLDGSNANWTATSQKELQFANLAPGSYRLEVEALDDRDGIWSEEKAVFPFHILTPWYWSWWFIGICALIPLSIIVAVLRLRMLSAQHRERELVRIVEEKTGDLQRANEELLRLSLTDPLTGLANRRVFNQILDRECSRLQRFGANVSLVMIDVDHFKALNDSEGHQKGDEYLAALGATLNLVSRRKIDVAARCGGEEFALILPETSAMDAQRIAERLRLEVMNLNLPHRASPVAPILTVSIGVATGTGDTYNSPEKLVAAADHALYEAKKNGRNRVEVAQFQTYPVLDAVAQ